MADESVYDHHDAARMIDSGSCDYINIKFAKSGGILEAQKIIEVARRSNIPCMMGGMLESRLALTAFAHFASANEMIKFYDMDTCLLGHQADPVYGGVRFDGYDVVLPGSNGLGATPDEDFYKKLRINNPVITMEQNAKTSADSFVVMTELVLPNDTNTFGNLMGGRLMYWMDIAAALAAMKHCGMPAVTASVDNISFENPILLGNVVHIQAKVSRAFNTSMEVHLNVWGENPLLQSKYKSNEAFYTFVALGPDGKSKPVPSLIPQGADEERVFAGALRRRQIRLILGGKMKPEDAGELKALFIPPATH